MYEKINFRILIADDNQKARKGLSALLNSLSRKLGNGVRIEVVGEAGNGQEALKMAGELAPDLVFMDIKMPLMDGLEATRRIKSESLDPKIVVLSMHNDQREAALASGADAFIAKGTDAQSIKQLVSRFILEKK